MPHGYAATRQNGVCRGSLWKQHCSFIGSSSDDALLKNEREKRHEYCILVGNTLLSYPDVSSYRRGDHPTSEIRIVGASAWNPAGANSSGSRPTPASGTPSYHGISSRTLAANGSTSTAGAASSGHPRRASLPAGGASPDDAAKQAAATPAASASPTFRIVTYAGTHVYCVSPTCTDRDVWLTALHSGLEACYAANDSTSSGETTLQELVEGAVGAGASRKQQLSKTDSLCSTCKREDCEEKDAGEDASVSDTADADSGSVSSSDDSDPWRPPQHARKTSNRRINLADIAAVKKASPPKRKPSVGVVSPPPPPSRFMVGAKYCRSCGLYKRHPSVANPDSFRLYYQACPLPQYNYETRAAVEWICQNCFIGQGLYTEVRGVNGLYSSFAHERAAMRAARAAARAAVRQGVERAVEEGKDKSSSGGNKSEPGKLESASSAGSADSKSLEGSWENVPNVKKLRQSPEHPSGMPDSSNHRNLGGASAHSTSTTSSVNSWHQISPSDAGTSSLLQLLQTPGFATLRRRSRALELECVKLESGLCSGAVEFLDTIDTLCGPEDEGYGGESSKMEMKKEAFKVAGDMSTAMKLLHDHALGLSVRESALRGVNGATDATDLLSGSFSSTYTTHGNSIYMLRCLLELLLDLCEDGELSAVSFFWPQLRHIHLRMLPPVDADALIRVELLEEFLLTVSARFSVHLALELLWGLVADLEEAFEGMNVWPNPHEPEVPEATMSMLSTADEVGGAGANNKCRMRRFSVLRFVCELESVMFDFEGGWGGGSVALKGMLSPSEHQAALIRENILKLQQHRLVSPHRLTRSVRRELLLREKALDIVPRSPGLKEEAPRLCSKCSCVINSGAKYRKEIEAEHASASQGVLAMPQEVLQRNAHYFASQVLFSRRLGDVAEKLRFTPDPKRTATLESELEVLNFNLNSERKRGRVGGGDPLCRGETYDVRNGGDGFGLAPVVNIPSKEGHVFRSKERTPILLLMEVIRDPGPSHEISTEELACSESKEEDTGVSSEIQEGEHSPENRPQNDSMSESEGIAATDDIDAEGQGESESGKEGAGGTGNDDKQQISANITTKTTSKSGRPDSPTLSPHGALNEASVTGKTTELPPAPPSTPVTPSLRSKSVVLKRLESSELATSPSPHISKGTISALSTPVIGGATTSAMNSVESVGSPPNRQRFVSVDKETEDLVASVMEEKLSLSDKTKGLKMPKLDGLGQADNESDEGSDSGDSVAAQQSVSTSSGEGEEDDDTQKDEVEGSDSKAGKDSSSKQKNATAEKGGFPSMPSLEAGNESEKNKLPKKKSAGRSTAPKMKVLGSPKYARSGNTNSNARQTSGQGKTIRNLSSLASNPVGAQYPPLAMFGEGRREVLTTILAKGMRGNVVAKGAAAAAQRAVQAMDRKRAVELIQMSSHGDSPTEESTVDSGMSGGADGEGLKSPAGNRGLDDSEGPMGSGGVKGDFEVNFPRRGSNSSAQDANSADASGQPTDEGPGPSCSKEEEEEAMESLRLLLIQNRVAQGNLSPEHAARALGPDGARSLQKEAISFCHEDAGEFDSRLSGCGPMSHGLLSALKLWKTGVISNAELLELAHKDQLFMRAALPGAGNIDKLRDDSAFWVRFSFGERWAEKKARISARSVHGSQPGWDLVSVIVKSNDDLRQEAFVMQLIELCQEAFEAAGLELWLQPYRIIATSRTTGIIETLKNALSFDSLKKRPGYQGMGGLRGHFLRMTEFAANPKDAFRAAQHNFVRSLAAYSLISYLFLFKDRHNGNLLLDTAGHVIHIDFGFVFGRAPGGSFSLESGTPFKFTEEMLEVMGGLGSPLFSEFVTLFCCGFLALQAHVDTFLTLVEITCKDSVFPCFAGKESSEIVERLRERFRPELNKTASVVFALDLIKQSITSYGTRQYDFFQYLSQGIAT